MSLRDHPEQGRIIAPQSTATAQIKIAIAGLRPYLIGQVVSFYLLALSLFTP